MTSWPVLTEAAWLLQTHPGDVQRRLIGASESADRIAVLPSEAASWIAVFVRRYESAEVQLADSALMYPAVHEKIETVLTTDRRHVSILRLPNNRTLRLLPDP